jgi:hypothetical protein
MQEDTRLARDGVVDAQEGGPRVLSAQLAEARLSFLCLSGLLSSVTVSDTGRK